jgi:hypothetical protein
VLERHNLARCRGDMLRTESGKLAQPTLCRMLEDLVRDAQDPGRHLHIVAMQEFQDGRSEPAGDRVLLDGDDR